MTYDEAKAITGSTDATTNDLRRIGGYYWLATARTSSSLYNVYNDGSISNGGTNSFGVRPVVVLKSAIKTTGKGTDAVGQEAWTLVKP